MNRRQRVLLREIITAVVITALAVLAMYSFKDWINRSESMRAMEHLGRIVLQYRNDFGLVPPESYVNEIREKLEGNARLGDMRYRARWIEFEAENDEILAYTKKRYSSLLLGEGSIVLRLDGRVEWLQREEFDNLLAQQQSALEKESAGR